VTYWLSIFMGHLWQLNDFKDHTFMRELSVVNSTIDRITQEITDIAR
jgi:hypothetical protein